LREYLVWNEVGDLISGPHRKRETAEKKASSAREWCRRNGCHTNGEEETPGKGNFKCGVLSEHGIHIQVTEGGYDITGHDY
jgi:hypothetical protein